MEHPRRRRVPIAVALPSSLLEEVPHLREKTARAGLIARALGIFRVDEAIIYADKLGNQSLAEGPLLEKLLSYQNTPQYLRRILYPKSTDLEFAGTLPPLRTPNHPDRTSPAIGQVREAIVTSSGEYSEVEAGFHLLVYVHSRLRENDRVTIRITSLTPRVHGELVNPRELAIYWGFRVNRGNFTLLQLLKDRKDSLTISTSRRGNSIRDVWERLRDSWRSSKSGVLILFGSPREGVPEILAREGANVTNTSFNVNTIPGQAVETVRTEEALFATLSVFNMLEEAS